MARQQYERPGMSEEQRQALARQLGQAMLAGQGRGDILGQRRRAAQRRYDTALRDDGSAGLQQELAAQILKSSLAQRSSLPAALIDAASQQDRLRSQTQLGRDELASREKIEGMRSSDRAAALRSDEDWRAQQLGLDREALGLRREAFDLEKQDFERKRQQAGNSAAINNEVAAWLVDKGYPEEAKRLLGGQMTVNDTAYARAKAAEKKDAALEAWDQFYNQYRGSGQGTGWFSGEGNPDKLANEAVQQIERYRKEYGDAGAGLIQALAQAAAQSVVSDAYDPYDAKGHQEALRRIQKAAGLPEKDLASHTGHWPRWLLNFRSGIPANY